MPWVRIDDNATDHPKFIAINANAWRLWCEGLTYCQKHLTDGLIPRVALRGLRYYSLASVKALTAVLVPGKGPLWHLTESGDVQVHDYLEHNEDRATVLAKREAAKSRMQRRRSREQPSEQHSERAQERTAKFARGGEGDGIPQALQAERERGSGGKPANALVEDELAERAGRFVERYAELFAEHRRGARYLSRPALDFPEAVQLCANWDDTRLETLAIAFLTTDDKFCRNGSGGIKHFASRASWCDGKLRERGL